MKKVNPKEKVKGMLDDLMAEVAEHLLGKQGKEIKESVLDALKTEGIPVNKQTMRAFGEGINFSIAGFSRFDEKRAKDIMVLAYSITKLIIRDLK